MYYISSERAKPTSYRIGNNPLKLKRPAKRSRQQLGHLNLLLSWNLRSASRHLVIHPYDPSNSIISQSYLAVSDVDSDLR